MEYPTPANEVERLATLREYRILDTGADPEFDNLVEIAGAHFNVPIALVSLVDAERQWFKAAIGLDATETPRHYAFCAHAINRPDRVLVVEDAALDPRFATNPLVAGEPGIRFYAGAPVIAANGSALGTVCIIDREPRAMTDADQAMLRRLATNASSLLEMHRRNCVLRDSLEQDSLTGLMNRRGLEIAIDQAMGQMNAGKSCGLLYLDVDYFKQINDAHGHEVGDHVLNEVAQNLRSSVRVGDMVARMGGDEFVILLAHPASEQAISLVAHRILENARLSALAGGNRVPVGISIGAALAPRDAADPSELLRKADHALYAAKRAGRGQLVISGKA